MDCSITTWDIPSGVIIDVFYTVTPPLSVTMSSLGHFIATSHVDEIGIFLWYVAVEEGIYQSSNVNFLHASCSFPSLSHCCTL